MVRNVNTKIEGAGPSPSSIFLSFRTFGDLESNNAEELHDLQVAEHVDWHRK